MAFRVYDIKEKKWLKENIYLNPNNELFLIKKGLFGTTKIPLDAERYVFHQDIYLYDKQNILVYEGDYIRARIVEGKEEIGLVAYAHELSGYVMLCVDNDTFYTLGSTTTEFIEVIGNVFDGYSEEKNDGKQTLQ